MQRSSQVRFTTHTDQAVSGIWSDVELLGKWRDGNTDAGNELLRRHLSTIYQFFRKKVNDGIDDLVQQTMLGCVQGCESFRLEASFRTYLFAIARNVLHRYFDRRTRELARIDHGAMNVTDPGESPSDVVAARMEQRRLGVALRRLPISDQIILELYYWESMTGSELAAVLGLPEPAIRSRLRRALVRLRTVVAGLPPTGHEIQSIDADLDEWARSLRQLRETN